MANALGKFGDTAGAGIVDVTKANNIGAIAVVVASGAAGILAVAATPSMRLVGFSVTESAAAPAAADVAIVHGIDISGAELFDIKLAASGVVERWFGPEGIKVPNGLFINRIAGTTKVTLFYKVVAD